MFNYYLITQTGQRLITQITDHTDISQILGCFQDVFSKIGTKNRTDISFLEENESIQVVKEILKNMYLHRTHKALKQDEVPQLGVQHTLLERQGASH